mgnify:CR=1 FL=1|tara:strand:- start:94 stop:324 length:231 start_codon:yes stop_codon:yes gene_type:complete
MNYTHLLVLLLIIYLIYRFKNSENFTKPAPKPTPTPAPECRSGTYCPKGTIKQCGNSTKGCQWKSCTEGCCIQQCV